MPWFRSEHKPFLHFVIVAAPTKSDLELLTKHDIVGRFTMHLLLVKCAGEYLERERERERERDGETESKG